MGKYRFCINCGNKLGASDNFCPYCGVKVAKANDFKVIHDKDFFLKYKIRIENLDKEYDVKVAKALKLINKEFDPSQTSYHKFISSINSSNNIFYSNVEVAMSIIDLSDRPSNKIKNELDDKILTLKKIIDKLGEFTDELVIHIADNSKKKVNDLTKELDDLIDSVKEY